IGTTRVSRFLTAPASGVMRRAGMPSNCCTSSTRSCVISPGRAPVYAHSHGTHRRAALSGFFVTVIAVAALRIVCHSSLRNAFVSRSLRCLGTLSLTSANGLRGTSLLSTAQPKTVLLAASQVLLTVAAERSGLTRPLIHDAASSGIMDAAL